MISVNDFRTGITIELEGDLYQVLEFLHVKPGKGAAFVRTKLKNLKTGYVVERTFRGGEKVQRAIVERKKYQYQYDDEDNFYFMDLETYEPLAIPKEMLGESAKWLKDGMEVEISMHGTTPVAVELPNFVELKVVETEPGFRGDTATGATKPATVEGGAIVQVPLFVEPGTVIQIDTRTGQYLRRV
ncbi:MAG TPA: elongation factor P [Candidatus Nitrosotenuis sp.]|nr:elongation factor P [Candidatus Nitrosotenuis sp.]